MNAPTHARTYSSMMVASQRRYEARQKQPAALQQPARATQAA
jgi:hypothetical protein